MECIKSPHEMCETATERANYRHGQLIACKMRECVDVFIGLSVFVMRERTRSDGLVVSMVLFTECVR